MNQSVFPSQEKVVSYKLKCQDREQIEYKHLTLFLFVVIAIA